MKHTTFTSLLSVAALAFAMDAEATMVVGDANTTTVVTPTDTIITATQNATLTVTEPGEIEILLVGGGGGAGGSTEKASGYTSGDSRGGGGGGGGVIHKTGFQVGVGTYFITVGAGGAVNRSNDTIDSATGGSTTGFGLTALGGGPGGCVDPTTYYNSSALAGASGGGGSKNSNGRSYPGGSGLLRRRRWRRSERFFGRSATGAWRREEQLRRRGNRSDWLGHSRSWRPRHRDRAVHAHGAEDVLQLRGQRIRRDAAA